MSTVRRAIEVRGVVQGVGFRPFVFGLAETYGLGGFVRNVDGEVEIEVEGAPAAADAFVRDLVAKAPPLARIAAIDVRETPPRGERGFAIRASEARPTRARPVPPDAATCDDCLRELLDPADRRYRYPFTNCTNCGPRFTIIDDLPYDRERTSMRAFPLCAACRREYEDPRDRRFHAEPVACPACGPRLELVCGTERAEREAALAQAEELIRSGGILALRGLGGFQLACDATNERTVRRLRERKHRAGKPFAIMVRDLEAARALCEIGPREEAALTSVERPIVLLRRRRDEASIAPSVAPGLSRLGVMLPTTPLHHLLLRDLGIPLIMTSGNLSDEPIATGNEEAQRKLATVADAFLLHDREILARYDDSVVREIAGAIVPVRRARGIAPRTVPLAREAAEEVLALGAHQKCTFCFVKGREAYLSQHVGDLENVEALAAFREALSTYRRLFRLAPRAIAHDLHPDYLSTREAARIAAAEGLPLIPVQHHHAHLASCLAEHGRTDRVVALTFDGTGLGTDGTIWGGEVLVGDLAGFARCGHLRPVRLPGGARTIRRCDRMALAHVLAAAPAREDLIAHAGASLWSAEARAVRHAVETGLNAPWTTSMGRLFDATAALLGLGPEARYEGELACLLEAWAEEAPGRAAPLPYGLAGAGTAEDPIVMDQGPTLIALIERRRAGEDGRLLAAAFHDAVAAMAVHAALRVAQAAGIGTIALTGGCFVNRVLAEACARRIAEAGLEPLLHRRVPPNDGGIALGQAAVAVAVREAAREGASAEAGGAAAGALPLAEAAGAGG